MKFPLLAVLLFLIASGCSEKEAYIADHVKFRVFFSKQSVQVSFDLNKNYQITENLEVPFTESNRTLGEVFIDYDAETHSSSIGTFLQSSADHQKTAWPVVWVSRFPNGRSFPESVPEGSVAAWLRRVNGESLEPQLMFRFDPSLVVGGSLSSPQFDALGEDFLATQHFRAANGDVEASISVAGPTKESKGGVYFFGNFGANPFSAQSTRPHEAQGLWTSDEVLERDEIVWTLQATEPAKIITPARRWWQWRSLSDLRNAVLGDIQSLQKAIHDPAP